MNPAMGAVRAVTHITGRIPGVPHGSHVTGWVVIVAMTDPDGVTHLVKIKWSGLAEWLFADGNATKIYGIKDPIDGIPGDDE